MACILWVALLIQLLILANPGSGVAPGDEEALCELLRAHGVAPTQAYSSNMRVLMDSWNYQNLLPPRMGAVWDQVDSDVRNSPTIATNVSFIIWYKLSIIVYLMYHVYSGFSSLTLHVNNLSKCVGSVLVHRTTG